jgi:hypothetical protein
MLDECAPGYTIRLANHSRVIQFAGKVYRTFPKHDPVENGHIRKLVRFLRIRTSCAAKHLPGVISDGQEPTESAIPGSKPNAPSKVSAKSGKKR